MLLGMFNFVKFRVNTVDFTLIYYAGCYLVYMCVFKNSNDENFEIDDNNIANQREDNNIANQNGREYEEERNEENRRAIHRRDDEHLIHSGVARS
jgi:hypothetical protein